MLFLPIEINTVKSDALVDSGAYINAISGRDAEKLRQDANQCIINKAPPPPFKVQYANAKLEQPLATYTLRFKIWYYTSDETFIVLNQTSFPIIGLATETRSDPSHGPRNNRLPKKPNHNVTHR